jgi:hypothetical protein
MAWYDDINLTGLLSGAGQAGAAYLPYALVKASSTTSSKHRQQFPELYRAFSRVR